MVCVIKKMGDFVEDRPRNSAGARPKKSVFQRGFIILFVGLFVFLLGVNVGNGSIVLGNFLGGNASTSAPNNLDFSSVETVYDALRSNFDGELDQAELLDGMKRGMVRAAGDPFTEFFSATETEEFNEQLSGEFSGIGAELGIDADGNVIVISPIAGFPAEKAGLMSRDIITRVNDEPLMGATVTEAVTKIRGPEGTVVKLRVVRDMAEELDFEITRAVIKIPSVNSEMLEDNIGYIQITRFGDDSFALVKEAANSFKRQNAKGIILDVRQNPGGLLDSSVDISGLWLPSGATILEEKRGDVSVKTYRASGTPVLKDVPTVVLIDEGSASASEIVAGALSDNNAATLIGVKSFGKGSVQTMDCLGGGRGSDGQCLGAMLKVTIARWYTPNGRNIDKEGIEPSQVVDRTVDDIKAGKDPQKDAAIQALTQ